MVEQRMSMHWADQLADKIIERSRREGRQANVKCQQTPSGGKHIGNLNDVARAFFPYKAVVERGEKAEFVHTTDDRDPLKDVPLKVPDFEGNYSETAKLTDVSPHLGKPLCRIPDPFGCCRSWAEHFTKVWMDGVNALGMHPKLYSVDALYAEGRMEPFVRSVFENVGEAKKIVSEFQESKGADYIPFDAICPSCGRLANADGFDLHSRTVHFVCGGKAIKKKRTEGCGFEGEVDWREGKLQWRFEWPALMALFNTTYEPFGKDHAEGSWKSAQAVLRRIFKREPPIPFVYEFFLVDGEKMSASKGNVYIVQDVLRLMEPDAFLFFYAKRPEKQRNLELSRIFALEDEFDSAERVYYGVEEERTEGRAENAKRMYELAVEKPADIYSRRVSYSFAAALVQLLPEGKCLQALKRLKHIETEREEELAVVRLRLAKNWVESHASEESRIRLLSPEESATNFSKLPEIQRRALNAFASYLVSSNDSEEQQAEKVRETCAEQKLPAVDFYAAAYAVLLGKQKGPRLFSLLAALGADQIASRLSGGKATRT